MSIGASYQSLADFLARRDGDVWNATFDEVERVLRRPLPRSAYEHQAWWANQNGRGHSQTHGWRSVGWRTAKLERPAIPAGVVREEPVADLAYALLILGGFALLALTLKGLERL